MSTLKNDDKFRIYDWMPQKMDLSSTTELFIYAIIYRDSQTESKCFKEDLQYLADWAGCTKRTVVKALNSLIEKGYIRKEKVESGAKYCVVYEKIPE